MPIHNTQLRIGALFSQLVDNEGPRLTSFEAEYDLDHDSSYQCLDIVRPFLEDKLGLVTATICCILHLQSLYVFVKGWKQDQCGFCD